MTHNASTKSNLQWLHRFGSPPHVYDWLTRYTPWFFWLSIITLSVGIFWGLLIAPPDYQQSETVRIIYVHVPAAILSMGLYMGMAVSSAVGLIWKMRLNFVLARSIAPIGMIFTAIALVTGSVWGKPMWGSWWEWDARLTSELILLFLYIGYLALHSGFRDEKMADESCAWLAIVGSVNVPIIHYSVEWWHTLHQGATISKFAKPSIDISMAIPLFICLAGFALLSAYFVFYHWKSNILIRYQAASWLQLKRESREANL